MSFLGHKAKGYFWDEKVCLLLVGLVLEKSLFKFDSSDF